MQWKTAACFRRTRCSEGDRSAAFMPQKAPISQPTSCPPKAFFPSTILRRERRAPAERASPPERGFQAAETSLRRDRSIKSKRPSRLPTSLRHECRHLHRPGSEFQIIRVRWRASLNQVVGIHRLQMQMPWDLNLRRASGRRLGWRGAFKPDPFDTSAGRNASVPPGC